MSYGLLLPVCQYGDIVARKTVVRVTDFYRSIYIFRALNNNNIFASCSIVSTMRNVMRNVSVFDDMFLLHAYFKHQ